jgi:DNA-binding transcriptional regulator YhcF (GntR family)
VVAGYGEGIMGRHKIPIDDLLSYIKIQIISGTYSIGAPIPSIRRLADKFQLRYNVVRNAIKLLVDIGYVQPDKDGVSPYS